MADMGPFATDRRKPAVSILIVQPVSAEIIEYILWGLEEEGIPYEIGALESSSAEAMAKQAADGSTLNVGIGINGHEEKAVLHHRDLPNTSPTLQVVVMPPLERGSPTHDASFAAVKKLGADYVRYVPWYPYPRLAVTRVRTPDGGARGFLASTR